MKYNELRSGRKQFIKNIRTDSTWFPYDLLLMDSVVLFPELNDDLDKLGCSKILSHRRCPDLCDGSNLLIDVTENWYDDLIKLGWTDISDCSYLEIYTDTDIEFYFRIPDGTEVISPEGVSLSQSFITDALDFLSKYGILDPLIVSKDNLFPDGAEEYLSVFISHDIGLSDKDISEISEFMQDWSKLLVR